MQIQRFGHAAIRVSDLAAAEGFYRDVLGFEVAARFPEDREVLLAVGGGDHFLIGELEEGGTAALDHVAFEVAEGRRGVDAAAQRLEELHIDVERVDHGGDPSIYFHAPDGHLVEICAAPGATPRFAGTAERLEAARRFVFANARLIDRAIFEHRYEGAPPDRVLAALAGYRNADGGFGHALEPDVRCASSQPLHTLTALELLREADIRQRDVANGCCDFLSAVATSDGAVPALLPDASGFPAADHWHGEFATQPTLGWTLGLAAALAWHGADHPWAPWALDAGRRYVTEDPAAEAHMLAYAVRFAGEVLRDEEQARVLERLRNALPSCALFVGETPVQRYGLTPLHYAPDPQSPLRRYFEEALIERHLDDLLDSQLGDGGWTIRFRPPSPAAELEWRGRWTLEALATLRAYGRLP